MQVEAEVEDQRQRHTTHTQPPGMGSGGGQPISTDDAFSMLPRVSRTPHPPAG